MFNAAWAEGKDLSSKTVLEATEAAVQRGVFGAPTFFVGNDLFFGQDRLEWVESAPFLTRLFIGSRGNDE